MFSHFTPQPHKIKGEIKSFCGENGEIRVQICGYCWRLITILSKLKPFRLQILQICEQNLMLS